MDAEYIFNEDVSPLEETAMKFSAMWYGDERTGKTQRKEVGKKTPVEF